MKIFKILDRKRDEIECVKIITQLEGIYDNKTYYTEDSLNSLFYRVGTLYKKYSHKIHKAIVEKDQYAINQNFILFSHSTILLTLTLAKKGLYEKEREALDYFTQNIPQGFDIPQYIINTFNNKNSENALRLAVIKSDEGKNHEVDYYLDIAQDHIYQRVDMAHGEKLGEIALFHFIKNNPARAREYLEMQYLKFQKDTSKIIATEITNNRELISRSQKAQQYQAFIEGFVAQKQSLKP